MLALFHDSIMHNVKKKGPFVQTLFTGMKALSATAGDTLGTTFQRNLFSSVHKSFGGKLRLIISGGAALNKRYWLGFRQMGFTIVEGYGLTETFGPITVSPGEDARWGSVGPALPENTVRIFEPDVNGIGEVLLKGSCVFQGYYNNDAQTREVFDRDGWFHTGDLGRLDKDGFLYLSGRKKDMIVLDSGKNVYPDELEDIFGASPLIEEIGIFGISGDNGEIVAAAIVPVKEIRKSSTITQASSIIYDELIRIGKNLPVYRRINDFVTVYNPLPRTTTRKLKKQELRKLYNSIKRKSGVRSVGEEQLSVMEMALMDSEEYIATLGAIASTSPKIEVSIINPRSHLEHDLGLDSLQRIDLLTSIEKRFGITVPDIIFDKMETVADIVSLIREHQTNRRTLSVENIMSLKERILNESPAYVTLPTNSSLFHKVTQQLVRTFTSRVSRLMITGINEVRTVTTPIIFASNHNQPDDVFDLLDSLPKTISNDTFHFADSRNNRYSAVRKMLHQHNLIIGAKENDPIELLRMSIAVIRGNKHLIAFPEGTMSKPMILGQFKSGIGLLACETGATIVPVKIVSPHHLASRQISGDKKAILFGKPISCRELYSNKPSSTCATEEIMSVVRSAIELL
jgi:long-chain acyl-CoA synthetase